MVSNLSVTYHTVRSSVMNMIVLITMLIVYNNVFTGHQKHCIVELRATVLADKYASHVVRGEFRESLVILNMFVVFSSKRN